jgi:hypothetical protein
MNTLATIVFWIASAAAAGALAITYHRGWQAVAAALQELEAVRAAERVDHATEADAQTHRELVGCASA